MTIPMTQQAASARRAADSRARAVQVRVGFQDTDFGLTQRESDVLHLLAEGRTAYSIGRALAISERTVHKHLQNAYRKLGANDRLSAVRALESVGF